MAYKFAIPSRYVLVFFLFVVNMVLYCQRAILGVAILAMVNHTAIYALQNETTSNECPQPQGQNYTIDIKDGSYVWTQPTQGIILGSYYYGSVFAQLTGGSITFLFGPKKVMIFLAFLSSLFVFSTPFSASFGVLIISLFQVIIGFFQGLGLPASYTLLARWSPENEKSTLSSVAYSGVQIGTMLGMIATGYLCELRLFGGWPFSFYVFGASGIILSIFLLCIIYERPQEHPRISDNELIFLRENISNIASAENKLTVPWKDILTSRPVWIIALTKISWGFGYYAILTKLPSYLKIILHFPIKHNGVINAIVYSLDAFSIFISGFIVDFIIRRKYFKLVTSRKIVEAIGTLVPAFCILSVPYVGCDYFTVVILLTIAMGCFGFTVGGDAAIVFDLAPDFAGTLFGLTNGLACGAGIISPYVVGLILNKNQGDMTQWSYVFYMASSFYFVSGIIFLLGATAKLQPWAISKLPEKK